MNKLTFDMYFTVMAFFPQFDIDLLTDDDVVYLASLAATR